MAIIEVKNVSKRYPLRRGTSLLLGKGGLGKLFRTENDSGFLALEDVSLEIHTGESLGIIGKNGSGKSTLLKILAGVTLPSGGTVRVEGRVASLLELGAGFHPMLTGRENIYLNAGLLGMRKAQVDQVFDAIVAFSGIADFIDQPVDTYSSGMYVRIAFSVAVHANPDIFLVDEVLAVGDEEFQRKCRAKIGELKEQGKTIVFVSHDLGIVHALCDRVVLLHKGAMIKRDTPQQTIDYYLRQIGRDSGIHNMSENGTDVIFNHGRISLFQNQQEITGPSGISASFYSVGQEHFSTYADWRVTESSPTHCRAEGQLARLPASLHIEVKLENARIHINCWLECHSESPIDVMSLRIQLPVLYQKWYLEDRGHTLPEISPDDVDWALVVLPDAHCRQVLLLSDTANVLPINVAFEPARSYALVQGYNCDYISGTRILECATHLPANETPLQIGRHNIANMTLALNVTPDEATAMASTWEQRRIFNLGEYRAQLENGYVTLSRSEKSITQNVHAHVQLCIGGMWIISRMFQWSQAWQEDGWTQIKGTSARMSATQHWMLKVEENHLCWKVLLECDKPTTLQEYNVSIGLIAEYQTWKTDQESGTFPDFDQSRHEWEHLNKSYNTGKYIRAQGPSLPNITLECGANSPELFMTALNTGCDQQARVLQALRTPGRGDALTFTPGIHTLFEGAIRLDTKG